MKKLLLGLVILLLLSSYFFFSSNDETTTQTPNPEATNDFHPSVENATFTFDGESISLENGRKEIADEIGFYSETRLLGEPAYGDINEDGQNDAATFIARSGAGSGVFVYVVGYISSPTGYKGTEGFFIGDRISPQSLTISNGVISVHILDRAEDEPYSAEPSIEKALELTYRDGKFEMK
jgi:hypothetical protein